MTFGLFAEKPGRGHWARPLATLLAGILALGACAPSGAGSAATPAKPAAPTAVSASNGQAASGAPTGGAQAGGATAGSVPTLAPLSPSQTVKYAASQSVSSSGIFIGVEKGYYKEQGIDVEIVPFSSAAEMIQPIAASQVDVANADTGAGIFNALSRGLPLRFVADGNHTEPGHSSLAWVVRKDLSDGGVIRDLPDLRGKRISPIAKGSLVDSLAFRTIEKAGLQPTDLDIEYVTFPDVLPAFSNKALDAAILTEPLVTTSVEQGLGVRWRGMDDLFGTFQSTLIMYSPTMTTQRQDVGKRFMVGYLRALRDYQAAFNEGKDLDGIIDILTKYTTIKDPAVYKKIVVPAFSPNGEMNVQSIKDLQQWYVDHGFVQNPVALDEFFDTSYLDYGLGVVGRQ
ncbi:MAG TPA: ABC transporter substrate-binding protein [Chloroflexota bacterium]|nr:ABC transporter substrate-binding protein [Chloroflexota bacterium]